MFKIGILIFNDVEELDFVGPYEVFTMVNEVLAAGKKPADVEVDLVGLSNDMVRCAKGMHVMPQKTINDGQKYDLFLVPGGAGTRPLLQNQAVLNWIITQSKTARWTSSVCTGSMLLVKSGVAKGKKITTHHYNFEEFSLRGLEAKLIKNEQYVIDGNVISSAGISAGIDMALYLVGDVFGVPMAKHVQSAMQYFPKPPFEDQ